ncbi:MAG: alkaline phosphatase family protein [Thaumarchaeota archaeon]|nr:alkaline phosphatase family protein [Nitrososphaerota archaeon]
MKKVILIGLDAAVPTLVQKYLQMGKLPNMQKLVNGGTWAEGIPVFPTHTASNWNTVSTGAWPKTHGVTDMVVHMPGTHLTEIKSGFYSDLCKAEQIWKTAERCGKKCILLKFIASWPPNIKKSVQVEGFGAPGGPGSRPWGSSPLALSNSSCYCTIPLENAMVMSFSKADLSDWRNISPQLSYMPPLESEIIIGPEKGIAYNVLLLAQRSKEYDTALLTKNKDTKDALILKRGQQSKWLLEDFEVDGRVKKASFRMKLIDIGYHNKEKFKLFVSAVFPIEGWTFPKSLSKELFEKFGPFLESISHFPYVYGWIDEDTYIDDMEYQADWMGKATHYLMSRNQWDLFMTQWHGIDNTQHAFLRFDKSVLSPNQAKICNRVLARTYEIADELVGNIVRANNKQKKKGQEIYTIVLSDHGHVMGKRRFFINSYLYQKGLIKLKRDPATKKIAIDWNNTQVFCQGMVHVYVNLKGREPNGIIKSGNDRDELVRRVIDLLYDIKDPKTGIRPIALALDNTDAQFLGLGGNRVGDIVYATNSIYASDNRLKIGDELFEDLKAGFPDASIHGSQLPSVDMGKYGTIKSMFVAHGPKIRKGYHREKPIHMTDIAPTIAHILGIAPPKNSEGAILHDIFE